MSDIELTYNEAHISVYIGNWCMRYEGEKTSPSLSVCLSVSHLNYNVLHESLEVWSKGKNLRHHCCHSYVQTFWRFSNSALQIQNLIYHWCFSQNTSAAWQFPVNTNIVWWRPMLALCSIHCITCDLIHRSQSIDVIL